MPAVKVADTLRPEVPPPRNLASPRSAIFSFPDMSMRRFWGLRSLLRQ
jgi:hypothetical protein